MYCNIEEVREMIKEDSLNQLIGNEYIEDEAEREEKIQPIIESAIMDADGEIDGYLNKRYPVPLIKIPKMINKISKDIALYNIFSRIGIDTQERESNYLTRYKSAVRFLENVAKGIIDIGIEKPQERAIQSFNINSNKRLFSRDTLRGM
jgi:phage gp36-like protein